MSYCLRLRLRTPISSLQTPSTPTRNEQKLCYQGTREGEGRERSAVAFLDAVEHQRGMVAFVQGGILLQGAILHALLIPNSLLARRKHKTKTQSVENGRKRGPAKSVYGTIGKFVSSYLHQLMTIVD